MDLPDGFGPLLVPHTPGHNRDMAHTLQWPLLGLGPSSRRHTMEVKVEKGPWRCSYSQGWQDNTESVAETLGSGAAWY